MGKKSLSLLLMLTVFQVFILQDAFAFIPSLSSGQITKMTYGNNVTSGYTYNPLTLMYLTRPGKEKYNVGTFINCHILATQKRRETPVKFMTVERLRKKLGISTRTAYRLVKEGKIPGAFKVGGTWRFREDLFYKWIEKETAPSQARQAKVMEGASDAPNPRD